MCEKMKRESKIFEIATVSMFLTGCPVASAGKLLEDELCVIDRCEDNVCTVETPEGEVEVEKKKGYREGKKIECPTWLIEPTQEREE